MKNQKVENFSRREFLAMGSAAAAVCVASSGCYKKELAIDPNLSVFCSDIHMSGEKIFCWYDNKGKEFYQPTYQNPLFAKVVDQILAMRPLPKNVVIFGDLALWKGYRADYEMSAPLIQKLKDTGINVILTTGNHDHRDLLFEFHPKQKEITPVPGRFVSIVDLGYADLVLLDTLNETGAGEGKDNEVSGTMDDEQAKWLLDFSKNAKRPFFCGAHHPVNEFKVLGKSIIQQLFDNPLFSGYIHGHDHKWYDKWFKSGWVSKRIIRSVALPSTGWWGNIGFATFRTEKDRATLSFVQNDFFFPKPLEEGEEKPKEWQQIIRDYEGASCVFTMNN